jgi:hypothetical protein
MIHGRLATTVWLDQSSTAVWAPSGNAPALVIALVVVAWAGDPPSSDDSVRETPVWRLNGGGDNGKERLSLGSNRTGMASICWGIRCTHSRGRLWENPNSNQLEIMILEIGFEKGLKWT